MFKDDEMAMESLESEAKVRFESILEKCHLPKSATEVGVSSTVVEQ